jgi:decaprenyl-phosphate phosphoribosyltransferase
VRKVRASVLVPTGATFWYEFGGLMSKDPSAKPADAGEGPSVTRPTLRGHLRIARVDHWFKNVFVLPGIVAAIGIDPNHIAPDIVRRAAIGLLSVCLVASSNYVINEVLDAASDSLHPVKSAREVPSGQIHVPLAYLQWLLLMAAAVGLGRLISTPFAIAIGLLWIMGCVYNIPPIRSKDFPYVDVLSEAVNNPLRLLAGWFITGTSSFPPASLLLSYWMVGAYFMAMKRYAEYRDIADPARAAGYRRSFAFYTEERLLVSIMFYGSAAMLFLGAFAMRYRFELVLSFPFVSLVMAIYLFLGLRPNSSVQRPEGLYREPALMVSVVVCALVICAALLIDMPSLARIFSPTAPTIDQQK